jgi:NTP pyrophosphatase (non-canonical NTP hydrolase)
MDMMERSILDYILKLSKNDKKTLSQKTLKTAEEVGELAKVVLPYDGAANTTHRFVAKERILEEVADTVLCALSVAYDLDFTHEEIAAIMLRKAGYWEELQSREQKAVYPLPYEIHVTVAGGEIDDTAARLEEFKVACGSLNVKPLLIDMHNNMGKTIMLDCQTSSVHMGENTSAITEVRRISQGLQNAGFRVIREKVETVPWHPAAPSTAHRNPIMPKDCYFEAHFNIIVTDETLPKLAGPTEESERGPGPTLAEGYGVHISRNAFKKISDEEYVVMATLRYYMGTYETFKADCDKVKNVIERMDFAVPKTITEFSIYDTNVSHDAG